MLNNQVYQTDQGTCFNGQGLGLGACRYFLGARSLVSPELFGDALLGTGGYFEHVPILTYTTTLICVPK